MLFKLELEEHPSRVILTSVIPIDIGLRISSIYFELKQHYGKLVSKVLYLVRSIHRGVGMFHTSRNE